MQESHEKLLAALQSSEHLGVPNPFRTAICFEVLCRVCNTFSRYKSLTDILINESMESIYCHDVISLQEKQKLTAARGSIAKRLFSIPTYFSKLKTLQQKQQVQQEKL